MSLMLIMGVGADFEESIVDVELSFTGRSYSMTLTKCCR